MPLRLALAWLGAPGPRTRRELRAAGIQAGLPELAARLEDHSALRRAVLGRGAD